MSDNETLNPEISNSASRGHAIQLQYPPAPMVPGLEHEGISFPLPHYLWILRRHAWKMAAFVSVCVLATLLVSARLKPIYESTATIDVDIQAPVAVVGQEANVATNTQDPDIFLATQMRLIQSDAVLRPVAEEFNLLAQSKATKKQSQADAQKKADAPVSLDGLRVNRPTNTYLLLINYRAPDPRAAADVANAIAKSYVAHTYDIRIRSSAALSSFMEKQLDELKAKMERSNMALTQFEREYEVINPEEKGSILSARLLQLNTDYTSAQSDRVRDEADFNAVKSGSIEAAEASSQGQTLTRLVDTLNQARQRFAEIKATYGTNHPEYHKAASQVTEIEKQVQEELHNISDRVTVSYKKSQNRERMLKTAVEETKAEWDHLNASSFQYQQLKQEAAADKTLYDQLVTKIHEADINAGFQNNNIRIADYARPSSSPVYPDTKENLLLAFLFSAILAIGAGVFLDSLDTTLRDPEQASRFLRTDVIGLLPLDRSSWIVPKPANKSTSILQPEIANANRKRYYSSISNYEESVRTIRNTILLSDLDQRLRSLVVTSAEPAEGKTTLAVHLAIANAASGKKTLLVDGDLRRPSIHSRFGLSPLEGLSNVLTGTATWKDVLLYSDGRPNLTILPSGPGSHRAADLIGPKLAVLLDEFAKEFDLVILDSPPLLGFAECLQMSATADGVVIISRAGETRRRAVGAVVNMLQRVHANVIGVILNQVTQNTSSDAYTYYKHYRYNYDRNAKAS